MTHQEIKDFLSGTKVNVSGCSEEIQKEEILSKRIIFADLDGTLIKTKSGETFPKGIWDMEFRFEVFNAIYKINLNIF